MTYEFDGEPPLNWHPLDIMVAHGPRPPVPPGPAPYVQEGHMQRPCPTCRGTGINPVWPSRVCPKCNGECKVPAR